MKTPIVDRRAQFRRPGRRRRYPRIRLAFEGFYTSAERMLFTPSVSSDRTKTDLASSGNLSLRGAYIKTPVPDAAGTRATLRIRLPGSVVMMKIPARVVWSNPGGISGPVGMGVRFEGALPWQLKRMAATLIRKAGLKAVL